MTWLPRLYRFVLSTAPEDFRRRYGDEAVDVAVARVAARRGLSRAVIACRELADLVRTARRERRADRDSVLPPPIVRGAGAGEAVARDLRSAWRSLRATPGFTAVALVILTLGIGASTAIFSVVDAVVLRGVPFDHGDRIMAVGRMFPSSSRPATETAATFLDWRDQQDVFDAIAASSNVQFGVIQPGVAPERAVAVRVTADLFPLLRVSPALGRGFTRANETPGQDRVAVISDGFWRGHFGATAAVLGKTLTTETGTWEIVGVMPPGFTYPVGASRSTDVWLPFAPSAADRARTGGRTFTWSVVGRLKPGVSRTQAQASIEHVTTVLAAANPQWFRENVRIGIVPLANAIVGDVRAWMLLLLGAVSFVLLIACVNVANLMLARATARDREMSVRAALGGTRWQLARGLLVESLLLSAIGTVCGVAAATGGVALLKAAMPAGVPRLTSIAVDLRVLAVASIAATITGVLFGLAPAIQGSRADVTGVLREGGRSSTAGAGRQRLRAGLVVVEVTLAAMLLVGAGLFMSSFIRFATVDLGFDDSHVLTLDAYLNFRDPSWHARGRPFVADVLSRLQQLPGVEAVAGIADGLPLSGSWSRSRVTLPGRAAVQDPDGIDRREVTPDYFKVMRIPLLRGRAFTDADVMGAERVAVINDVAERVYFGPDSALGQPIVVENGDTTVKTIVGVVRGIHIGGPDTDVRQEVYFPIAQYDVSGADFVMRTTGDPNDVREAARAAVLAVRPDQTITEISPLDSYLATLGAQRKLNMELLALFGLLGIVIAGAGIYGVVAYIVAQRTTEIGIRMALGAQPEQILARVLASAALHVAVGLALGLAGAWNLSRFVESFLFKIGGRDPAVYAGVAALLMLAGLVAAFIPAQRAARVDPVIALR